MNKNILPEVLHKAPFGYACHKILLNGQGEPIDYIFLDVNPAFEEMTGLQKDKILGKRVTQVLPGIRAGGFDWVAFYGRIAITGETSEFTQYAEPLGRWYEVTAFSPREGYFTTIFYEITGGMRQIKNLEAQKRHIRELTVELEKVFNTTQDAMFFVKVEDGGFRYIRSNVAHQKLTGLSLEQIKYKTPIELAGKEVGEKIEENYRRCVEARATITYEETLELPGGRRSWLTSLNPVIEDRQVKYIVGCSKDITLQKKAEYELRKRFEYEKVISGVSRLALQERDLDLFLTKSLGLMGENIGVSRVYIFESDRNKGTMSNTFEWTSLGTTPQKENLQDIPETEFNWWMEVLKNGGVINYRDIEDIPDQKTKEILKQQDIKSLLVLPVYVDGQYYGFIGFDDCMENREWTESDIALLKVAAEVISWFILLHKKEESLWSENQRFKALVDSTEDVIFELDREQRHTVVYGRWIERAGLKPEFFLGKTARELFGPERAYAHEKANKKALAGEKVLYEWNIEMNGQSMIYQTSLSPIRDREGMISGIVGVGRDITELIKIQQELQTEKEFLRTTLNSIGDGVVTTDKQGMITSINKMAEKITGWREEEATGMSFSQVFKLISKETGQQVEDPVAKVLRTGKIIGLANHTVLITRDGHRVSVADSAAPIKDEKGNIFGVVMVFRDVTKEERQQERITYLSYHDPLTGLYNRGFMEEQIKRLDNSMELPLAVIMGDLNGLKLFNDVFGHEEGDKLLKKAAVIIRKSCRREDVVARWGGDEFLILLPCSGAKTAEEVIERIRNRCVKYACSTTQVSMALGYSVKRKTSENLRQTLREAEEQMYRRKLLEGKSYRNSIINTMLATLYAKSMETEEHAKRLQYYCLAIGRELKLSPKEMDELALLAVLHDMGKVAINENVLKKPGPLTLGEWGEMKKHPEIGYRIARNTPELASVAEYILFHHERWDGRGYPRGLRGEGIPLLCRILAVADAYDAMTTDRCYRKAMSREDAIAEIERNAGTQFDPVIADIFCRIVRQMEGETVNERGSKKNL